MKINGYILANRTQEAPIPIPGTEVQATLDFSTLPTIHASIANGAWVQAQGGYYTDHWTYPVVTTSGAPGSITENGYTHDGWLPTNRDWETGVYADEGWGVYDQAQQNNVVGNVKISGLQAGKYVIVLEHYLGCRDVSRWQTTPPRDSNPTGAENMRSFKTIKQGTYGIVYGEYNGDYVYDQSTQGYEIGNGRVSKFTQKCNVTVDGTSQIITITFGDSSFSIADFCDVVTRYVDPDGNPMSGSRYFTSKYGVRVRVYTDGGNS